MSDPVIDSVRSERRRISAEHGHNVRQLGRYLTIVQTEDYSERLVHPRRTDKRVRKARPKLRKSA